MSSAQPALSIVTTGDSDRAVMQRFVTAVAALARQREMHIELLIVDDLGVLDAALHAHPHDLLDIRILHTAATRGQFAAMRAGIAAAGADCALTLDPDMAGNLADIDAFLAARQAGCDLVYGRRLQRADTPRWRRLASALFNIVMRGVSGSTVNDINTPMVMLSRRAMLACAQLPAELPAKLLMPRWFATSYCEIPVRVTAAGKRSHYSARQLLLLAMAQLRAAWRFRRQATPPAMPDRSRVA